MNYIRSLIEMPEGRCGMRETGSRGSGTQDIQRKRARETGGGWEGGEAVREREMNRKKWRR